MWVYRKNMAVDTHIPSHYLNNVICFHTMLSEIVIHHTSWITTHSIVGWLMLHQYFKTSECTFEHFWKFCLLFEMWRGRGLDVVAVWYHCCVGFECELSQAAWAILSIGYYSAHNKWMMSHLHKAFMEIAEVTGETGDMFHVVMMRSYWFRFEDLIRSV